MKSCKAGYGKRHKPRTFGKRARRKIKEACFVLEEYIQNVYTLTITLPSDSPEAIEAFPSWTSWFVNTINNSLRRTFSIGLYVYCWEMQERGALHLHYAMHIPLIQKFDPQKIKLVLIKTLKTLSTKAGIDFLADNHGCSLADEAEKIRIYLEPVQWSLQNYMSKFDSKKAITYDDGTSNGPGTWYNISKSLRSEIEKRQLSLELALSSEDANAVISALSKRIPEEWKDYRNTFLNEDIGLQCWIDSSKLEGQRHLIQSSFCEIAESVSAVPKKDTSTIVKVTMTANGWLTLSKNLTPKGRKQRHISPTTRG